MVIQKFTPQDAADVAALISRLFPDRAVSAEEVQRMDRDQDGAGATHARAVVRAPDDTLAACVGYEQSLGQYHPRKFVVELIVAPEWRAQGLGTRLYDWLLSRLTPHDPLSLRVAVREEDEAALQFARQRDFREDKRYWVSSVDPALADMSALPALKLRLAERGVSLLSATELAARDPDGWQAQIHALFSEVRLDVPRSESATPISLEQYTAWILDDAGFLPDAFFLAQDGAGDLIGQSDLYRSSASRDLFIGLTGVRRPWRGLGVGKALKLRGLQYARKAGIPRVWTDNESGNAPILKVNEALGFVRKPAVLSMVRVSTVQVSTVRADTLERP
ncbi:N-acetyltransferase family protein [Deinococcus sp.]|uniref:GNAT family N-acetyltransferase n=1 Tax=Deinococcus sp. TaxID=47478 RepID=UPI003C7D4153